MATVKVEHIFKMMRDKELPYWRLTDNTGTRMMIAENDTEENVETGITMMEEALDNIEDNVVCVMLSNKTKKQKAGGGRGYHQFEFKINLGRAQTGFSGGNNGMMAMMFQLMEKNSDLLRKIEIAAKEKEFDVIRQELKELKEGSNTDKLITHLLPHLDKLLGVQTESHGIAATGEEDETVDEKIVEKQKKVRIAIKRLAKIDADLPDTLTMLAEFAEKKPDKYKSFIPMLQNMI